MGWAEGEIIVRREVWRGSPWMAVSVIVVADEPELLATYLPHGAQFAFPAGDHGLGPHPVAGPRRVARPRRPDVAAARRALCRLALLDGAERAFAGWYVNLQEPFRRTPIGYDTYDLELDVWIPAGGEWSFKDDDLLDVRVA